MDCKVHMSRIGHKIACILVCIIKTEDQVLPYRKSFQEKTATGGRQGHRPIGINGKCSCITIVIKSIRSHAPRTRCQSNEIACNGENGVNHRIYTKGIAFRIRIRQRSRIILDIPHSVSPTKQGRDRIYIR